jgi:tRNA (mo5U34)-methyltransferase
MDKAQKQELVSKVPFWWHSIDLGDGVVSPGRSDLPRMLSMWKAMDVPNLKGKSVLDIGAWDGYFSFEAERRGADRVVALDRYVWCLDFASLPHSAERFFRSDRIPPNDRIPRYWRPDTMPTKAGFNTAHRILNSRVEQYIDDFATVDPIALGSFDVVFYLGGLYHMQDPLSVMHRLALVTRSLAIIETAGIELPGDLDREAFFEFYEKDELRKGDTSNWWAPNGAGLIKMCRAAGFRDARILAQSHRGEHQGYTRLRLYAHAWH